MCVSACGLLFVNETILMHHLNTYHIPFNRISTGKEDHSDAIVIR